MTMTDTLTLVDADLRARLIARVTKDSPDVDPAAAVDAAVEFLASGRGGYPGPVADAGWHAFILCTRDYAAFCERVRGRFVHHTPRADRCGDHCEDPACD